MKSPPPSVRNLLILSDALLGHIRRGTWWASTSGRARRLHRDGRRDFGAASAGAPNWDVEGVLILERAGYVAVELWDRAPKVTTGNGGRWTGRRDDGSMAGRCPGGSWTIFGQIRRDGDQLLGDGMVD